MKTLEKPFACPGQEKSLLDYFEERVLDEPQAILTIVGELDVNYCESHHHQILAFRPKKVPFTAAQNIFLENLAIGYINEVVLKFHDVDYDFLVSTSTLIQEHLGKDFELSEMAAKRRASKVNKAVTERYRRHTAEYKQMRDAYRASRQKSLKKTSKESGMYYAGGGADFAAPRAAPDAPTNNGS